MGQVENDITKEIIKLFGLIGWIAWRQNNNPTPIRKGRHIVGMQSFHGMKGLSDVIALEPRKNLLESSRSIWWIEVKNPSIGKNGGRGRLSKDQKKFRDLVQEAGHVYVVAYSASDVMEELKQKGMWK